MEPNFTERALLEIKAERVYQDNKWGTTSDDTQNTPFHWVSYLAKYSTGWMRGEWSFTKEATDAFRTAMIKVAAIAVAAVESIDRQRSRTGKAFFEN